MASRRLFSLKAGILAAALALGAAAPAWAVLSPGQVQGVNQAVVLPVDEAVLALRSLFAGNLPDLVELAEEATRQAPALCEQIMTEGTRASPDDAGNLAAAIIAIAPECEEAVAQILANGVVPAAGPGAPAVGAPGGPAGPNPSPIAGASATAENPGTDTGGGAPAATTTTDTTTPAATAADTVETAPAAVASPTTL